MQKKTKTIYEIEYMIRSISFILVLPLVWTITHFENQVYIAD